MNCTCHVLCEQVGVKCVGCWRKKGLIKWSLLTQDGSRAMQSSLFCPCCLFSCLLWQFQGGTERREHFVNRPNKCSVHQITVFKAHPELPVKHCWLCTCLWKLLHAVWMLTSGCSGFCTLRQTDLQIQGSGFKISPTEFNEFMFEPKMIYLINEC